MRLEPRHLNGTYEIFFEPIEDERGFFMRLYDRAVFADQNLQTQWEQESISFNAKKDTLRGLHFQMPPFVETKVVRVVQGSILDVFVDLRTDSSTYGKWDSVELSPERQNAIYIPKGFAHGFRSLADSTIVQYMIDVPYRPELASGIRWDDDLLSIDWGVEDPVISERDRGLQWFREIESIF